MAIKVGLYARTSTAHHEQNPEVQLVELRAYARARGWQIHEEYTDHGYSGGSDDRPALKRMLLAAKKRQIDVVATTKLDRLFRSLKSLVTTLDDLQALGVQFVATRDAIDYTTPSGKFFIGVLGSLAEFERSLILERTMAGLNHARAIGKVLGRPTLYDPEQIRKLRAEGLTYKLIQQRTGAPMGCIASALKDSRKTPSKATKSRPKRSSG